ncbi:Protein kinase superfamily protein [Klebsormidium nitens]|uniref:Protein kinase superfamily protein n=1 Tax=Klebsormidium nitens TaxID=105231 RepID=A0A1Y1I2Y8_KLENI|nr:Protein kinase superfamily protein [Klebsormidium nitens]|eukprot:GAQ83117.1 Protein kinase superfamily protein [Klebsormidium nitens]
MGFLKRLFSGGSAQPRGGVQRPGTAPPQRTGSAPVLRQNAAQQQANSREVKLADLVNWTNLQRPRTALDDKAEARRRMAEWTRQGRGETEREDHVLIKAAEGSTWSLHYPTLRSGHAYLSQVFELRELQLATRGFHQADLVGEGGFGKVFKAVLTDGRVAAVKQLDRGRTQGDQEFWVEVEMLSRLRSPHVLTLWGFCAESNQRLLVYEYMRNGSLQDQLHRDEKMMGRPPLDWPARLQIALDVACALEYLHEVAQPPVIHGDLKSSNILLDFDFKAKLADLGLAKRVPAGGQVRADVLGTHGYCAPDYAATGRMTTKSDVYSFGVVLLELITGRAPLDLKKKRSLVSWALPLLRDKRGLAKMVDPALEGCYSMKDLCQVAAIATLCLQSKGEYRPLMGDVVTSLLPLVINSYNGAEGFASELEELLGIKQQQQASREQSASEAQPGSVHRAFLADGREVILAEVGGAWVRLAKEEFATEATIMTQLSSPHLLTPWGYSSSPAHRLLMFNSVPNGSLEERLGTTGAPRSPRPLDWDTRVQVALDCARGLGCLHEKGLVHGDFRATNVLLDQTNTAQVSAFGVTKPSTGRRGAVCHVAPEAAFTGTATPRSDVYSYGLMLLQLITGEHPAGANPVAWAMSLVTDHKRLAHVTDPHLQGQYPFRDVSHVAAIAAMCLQPEPAHRPLMTDIVTSLMGIAGRPKTVVPPQERGAGTRAAEGVARSAPQLEELAVPEDAHLCHAENSDISVFGERTPAAADYCEPDDFSSDELQISLRQRSPAKPRKMPLVSTSEDSEGEQHPVISRQHDEELVTEPSSSRTAFLLRDEFPLYERDGPLSDADDADFASDREEQFLDEDDDVSDQGTGAPSVHDGWKSTPSGQVYVSRDYDFAELQASTDESSSAFESDARGSSSARGRHVAAPGPSVRSHRRQRSFEFDDALRREVKLWPIGSTRSDVGVASVGRFRRGRPASARGPLFGGR